VRRAGQEEYRAFVGVRSTETGENRKRRAAKRVVNFDTARKKLLVQLGLAGRGIVAGRAEGRRARVGKTPTAYPRRQCVNSALIQLRYEPKILPLLAMASVIVANSFVPDDADPPSQEAPYWCVVER
jgi:hypothetical protein